MENSSTFEKALNLIEAWKGNWSTFNIDESLIIKDEIIEEKLDLLQNRLKNNYPFHHPCYVGQMLKPPHPIAVSSYLATMRLNPNNHALDGGPATAELEKEAISLLANMFGFEKHLGHLTSSGTIANLEALWIAREIHPDKPIVYSEQAHYTHSRMCEVLKAKHFSIKADKYGKMDLNDLESKVIEHNIGTVVVTVGTTGVGALDELSLIVDLAKKYHFRIHVDSAYGGFYSVLKNTELIKGHIFKAIAQADSVVIDPHKHGLQPYGCGCIIFSDPKVGKFYSHASPYTYFTSKELHLGEISLECSRAGASAAAFWTTLQALPLEENKGFGTILSKTRQAGLNFSKKIKESENYILLLEPELDIVCYFPKTTKMKVSEISEKTEKIFNYLEHHPTEPLYLAKFKVTKNLGSYTDELIWDTETLTVLRSCFMKPEHLDYLEIILNRLESAYLNII
jgi:glutamate/tyrosine decarboxylase-like PLP-dependent enzyme